MQRVCDDTRNDIIGYRKTAWSLLARRQDSGVIICLQGRKQARCFLNNARHRKKVIDGKIIENSKTNIFMVIFNTNNMPKYMRQHLLIGSGDSSGTKQPLSVGVVFHITTYGVFLFFQNGNCWQIETREKRKVQCFLSTKQSHSGHIMVNNGL